MEPLSGTAIGAMRLMLSQQPNTEAKVAFAWAIAAGPALKRAASVQWTTDGTLVVTARTDDWRREIARARPTIAARMATLLGPDVVKRLTVV
jgi:hypothetical protein